VKIPRDQTRRAAQRVPGWWIEGLSQGGCQVIIQKA
jgi:hypothetical protein